jgi:hypothetical protein
MPEYLTPGVYIEEIELGGKPIEGVSTSTAGFLGKTERGPITPILITGFEEFNRVFGGYISDSYLAYAVDGFFRNGGKRCYIGRIAKFQTSPAASPATFANDSITVGLSQIYLKAIGPGIWGNRIYFKVEKATQQDAKGTRFKLTLMYFSSPPPSPIVDPTVPDNKKNQNRRDPTCLEVYDNISVDPHSSSFYKKMTTGSYLVQFFDNIPASTNNEPLSAPDTITLRALHDGVDGVGEITIGDYQGTEDSLIDPITSAPIGVQRTGLRGLSQIDEISIVCAPDQAVIGKPLSEVLIDHCEEQRYRFAILQAKLEEASSLGSLMPDRESKYAAFYLPWVNVFDPLTGDLKLVPPGGHIAGIYARSDIDRGVHKAPANEIVRGVSSLQILVTKEQQGILNPKGINVIRAFPGRGILVWGARTLSTDTLWKYINVRRLFIYIEQSIEISTQWLVFEPNSERLWSRVIATITPFLSRLRKEEALMGTRDEEAFFVKCDRTTMTQDDIDNGRLIVVIGVAPVKPAEFVIFRIAQTRSGAQIEEI